MTGSPLVVLDQVTKAYPMGDGQVTALDDLSLAIAPGEFVILLGPSGSGKTTLLNLIGGLDQPSRGRIWIADQDLSSADPASLTAFRATKVGFVFQFFNLIPTLTARENVQFALDLAGRNPPSSARISDELLRSVDLAGRSDHFPAQLSGGEQQRVAVARALSNQPALLLCDEPTGNLDLQAGRGVLELLQRLNREQSTTVILATHNRAIADIGIRSIRLQGGRISSDSANPHPRAAQQVEW